MADRTAPRAIGDEDLQQLEAGEHLDLHRVLGAHTDGDGTRFAVWAPNARHVSVVGDWNGWDPQVSPMARLADGEQSVWVAHAPAAAGQRYQYAVTDAHGHTTNRADPLAQRCEPAPGAASIVHTSSYRWGDDAWVEQRSSAQPVDEALSVYELHIGSWRHHDGEPGFRSIADDLCRYVTDLGFTHVELLPVMAHPFGGSWGYQVTSYFAPAARWGEPDDLKHLIDTLHQAGIGVILDWVPGHFPKDPWALGRFDGTPLYEHADPQRGEHPDWGTYVFDYGRGGVRSFLLSSARYWLEEFHADGLRVDAVASMLHRDFSRKPGEWTPNRHGGVEDLEAVSLLHALNEEVRARHPGVLSIAEESTAWPGVTRPVRQGGLGFGLKWNLGWMHDTLDYLGHDPVHRVHHHQDLTFGAHYAFSEQFLLPLSHDEVVHEKRSLLAKMAGDRWQQLANLRALLAWMWAHPGKQLLFMGGEIAQEHEWDHDGSVDWPALADRGHAGVQQLVQDLNRAYRERPALWSVDADPAGFAWLDDEPAANVAAFLRIGADGQLVACAANFSPTVRYDVRLGLPTHGRWREILNTDSKHYAGSGVGNLGEVVADGPPAQGQVASALVTLPPLAVVWFEPVG